MRVMRAILMAAVLVAALPVAAHANIWDVLWQGHQAMGNGQYDEAIAFYEKAITMGSRSPWTPEMIRTARERKAMGNVRPEVVHRAAVIHVTERHVIAPDGAVTVEQDVSAEDKARMMIVESWLARVLETLSHGHMSITFDHVDAVATYPKGARLKPDNPDHLNMEEYFLENTPRYDTFIVMSNTRSPARGLARTYPYLNGVAYGPARGMFAVNPGVHDFGTWLHEFFHVIEWGVGGMGGPAHGWRDDLRGAYPGWKGQTEFDYYRWHFANTIPAKGWALLEYARLYPALPMDAPAREAYARVREEYGGVTIAARQEADEAVKAAMRERDLAARASLMREAVGLSPYNIDALAELVKLGADPGGEYIERLGRVLSFVPRATMDRPMDG